MEIQLNFLVIIHPLTQMPNCFGEFVQGKHSSKHSSELDYRPHCLHEMSDQKIKLESHVSFNSLALYKLHNLNKCLGDFSIHNISLVICYT